MMFTWEELLYVSNHINFAKNRYSDGYNIPLLGRYVLFDKYNVWCRNSIVMFAESRDSNDYCYFVEYNSYGYLYGAFYEKETNEIRGFLWNNQHLI